MNEKIKISISERLLKLIEVNIEGNDLNEKITACVEMGYQLLKNGE